MQATAAQSEAPTRRRLESHLDLTGFFTEVCAGIGASSYMLAAVVNGHDRPELRIIASNWVYDAIRIAGEEFVIRLASSRYTVAPGCRPLALECNRAPDAGGLLDGGQARLLDVLGHAEIYGLRLNVGRSRYCLLLSAAVSAAIDASGLPALQMRVCYALSEARDLLAAAALQDPLSERERECLYWVSAGKTTDDVAMILGVSSNTVNSYVAHAIQKFSARNRTMAMATAIRNGII